ncbi:hypothetical protein [Abditibacterium utsteinense]|nr:hypothetical protein [Abditibacterium utsteinense]
MIETSLLGIDNGKRCLINLTGIEAVGNSYTRNRELETAKHFK